FAAGGGITLPGPPTSLEGTALVGFVTLFWLSPSSGDRPLTYVIEAGSQSGASDLALVATRSSETLFAAFAPNGRYFIRVRASNGAGIGPPSNEIQLASPGFGTCVPPQSPPTPLTASASGSTLTLQFSRVPAGDPELPRYVVQGGTVAGASDIG